MITSGLTMPCGDLDAYADDVFTAVVAKEMQELSAWLDDNGATCPPSVRSAVYQYLAYLRRFADQLKVLRDGKAS